VQNYEKLLSSKDENVQRKMTELKLQVAELMQQLADEQRLTQTVRIMWPERETDRSRGQGQGWGWGWG